ncbi:MAG: SpoIID/LytB domain-containing protein [Ignavibacteriales bacterium]|nr:MAG: SpoIID/LytB domain-containing protein [Ignavibacteriales bacterium]
MTIKVSFIFLITFIILAGCSGTERFTSKDKDVNEKNGDISKSDPYHSTILNAVRVLLYDSQSELTYIVQTTVTLSDSKNKIAVVKKGNVILFTKDDDQIKLKINGQSFENDYFEIQPEDSTELINFNSKNYRGKLRFLNSDDGIKIINVINIEDYLKGVLPSEMPLGKGDINLEALKAFSICARSYTLLKLEKASNVFDLYVDVRDQVYGGADTEKQLSNRAVEETRGTVLFYDNKLATTFYHSTCGGKTENSVNVFTKGELPYLSGVGDGEPSYCSISPRFKWKEVISRSELIKRFKNASVISGENFELENIEIKSRFESGRVSELSITLVENEEDQKTISLYGNNIRSVIRTADNKSILFSNWFDVSIDGNDVVFSGRGYGHGVGMCQYGAINMSHQGKDFREIINHYFPGTVIEKYEE